MDRFAHDEQKPVTIKAIGVGRAAGAALENHTAEDIEILSLESLGSENAKKAVAGADLLLIVAGEDDLPLACDMARSVGREGLVFSVVLPQDNGHEVSGELLARLEELSDALFIASHLNTTDLPSALLRCVRKSLPAVAMSICVDFEDMKSLFSNVGRAFFITGEGDAVQEMRNRLAREHFPAKLRRCLLCVEADDSVTLAEVMEMIDPLCKILPEECEFVWSFSVDTARPKGSMKFAAILA